MITKTKVSLRFLSNNEIVDTFSAVYRLAEKREGNFEYVYSQNGKREMYRRKSLP